MNINHLRRFVVLAEELHFGRAASRMGIDSSLFSRSIKELEAALGLLLFERGRGNNPTKLTAAGEAFLIDVRQSLAALDRAKLSALTAAAGQTGALNLAVSDFVAQPRLAALLALSREEEPWVDLRVMDVPLAEQLRGLQDGTFDGGFARLAGTDEGLQAYPIWQEDLVAVVNARHPLLVHSRIPLDELSKYPIVLHQSDVYGELSCKIDLVLSAMKVPPRIAEKTTSMVTSLTLAAADFGVTFAPAERVALYRYPEIATRPLDMKGIELTTHFLVKAQTPMPERLESFVRRVDRMSQCYNASCCDERRPV